MTLVLYELVGADTARPFSPHCWKAAMAIAHKGLTYRGVPTPFTKVPLVEGGFSKTVPVIRDGERIVSDSFAIAQYLEETYPDRPSLFGGPGGEATARFIERWSQLTIHPQLMRMCVLDICNRLGPEDQAYFRPDREKRLGTSLEEAVARREAALPAFRTSLEPLRSMLTYQPFIGGQSPLFSDYIVFGAFQWARITSPFQVLAGDDPVADWFKRCLDLHGGLGFRVPVAA